MKISRNWDLNADKKHPRPDCSLRHKHRVAVALGAAVFLALAQSGSAQCPHCTTDIFAGSMPLNDLGQGEYIAENGSHNQGGLYPGGFNQRPADYNNTGLNIAGTQIYPRNYDTGERDSQNGKIVMISIGMCNTTIEFGIGYQNHPEFAFKARAMADKAKRPKLVVVDCAQSGKDAAKWAAYNPHDQSDLNPWKELYTRLGLAGVSPKQVQIVWLKEALIDPALSPYGPWPIHVQTLQSKLETILDDLTNTDNFGNVKMVFLSPRTRAWTLNATGYTHSPEPYAYETGFADKWLIQERIQDQSHSGWPWLSWGPYLWADGINKRSDGLKWLCSDVQDDCVHPVTSAVTKVADQLLAFFKTDPVARPWFLKTPAPNAPTFDAGNVIPTSLEINAGGPPRLFHALATFHAPATRIVEYAWTFDDGCYAHDPSNNPLMTDVDKKFPAPSQPGNPYKVHVTAIDDMGNAGFFEIPVTVNAGQARGGSVEDTKHQAATSAHPKQGVTRKVGNR